MPRQAALALDAFQQRGFLAADIGAGAAPHVQRRTARRQLGDLEREHLERGRIFVADVDVDVGRIDDMRADQRALEETVRIALQIEAILEGAGLALVAVDRHQPRPGLAEHRAPFAPGRKAGAAEPAQAGIVERLQHVFLADAAGAQIVQQLVAAVLHIGVVVDIGRDIADGYRRARPSPALRQAVARITK